ncbi:MAG: phosphotransferase [Hydrogenophilaceae bacterium]|jgi:hypothetical protein|nr:phosphotransferase [Hydrogenophilaceae bacterium]
MRLPTSVEEITTPWLAHALASSGHGDVVGSRIIEVVHGTATKIHIEATFANGSDQRTRKTFWIKTGFENHSHEIGQETVYAGEVYYYANLAGRWDTRSPQCYFTQREADTGNSLIIMADLLEKSPRFFEPVEPISTDLAGRAAATLARIHASSWKDPFLKSDPWLASGGAWVQSNVIGWLYSDDNWRLMSGLPRFSVLPAQLRDRDLLRDAHVRLIHDWRESVADYCLSHGDAHMGQGYVLPCGEVEFLDWQCVTTNSWANDLAYFIGTALSIEDRRACEKDILAYYLSELKARDVAAPDFADAFELYRAYAFHGVGWVCCKPEMQSEENCAAIAERCAAAVLDLDAIGAVRDGPTARMRAA